MSDFADRPFAAGALTGLRAFQVDGLGRLAGPHRGGIFKPGENVATCYRSPFEDMQRQILMTIPPSVRVAAGLGNMTLAERLYHRYRRGLIAS